MIGPKCPASGSPQRIQVFPDLLASTSQKTGRLAHLGGLRRTCPGCAREAKPGPTGILTQRPSSPSSRALSRPPQLPAQGHRSFGCRPSIAVLQLAELADCSSPEAPL